jgi:hypothetical protein
MLKKIVSVFESCCFTILYNCLPTPILTNLKRNPFLQTESKAFWRSTKHATKLNPCDYTFDFAFLDKSN